jgi:molybdate transport system substrate-binding protein
MDEHGADMLEAKGLSTKASRIPLGESFIGVAVKAGQPKPDISTVNKLKQALLDAKSIAYSDSSSGTYLSTVGFKKLGIAEQVMPKSRKVRGPPSGEPVAAVVARGEAEIGFQQVAEIIHVPGIEFVGTVPAEIQPPTYFVGELTAKAKQPDAAVALLKFLSSAEAAPVITKAGLKPVAR